MVSSSQKIILFLVVAISAGCIPANKSIHMVSPLMIGPSKEPTVSPAPEPPKPAPKTFFQQVDLTIPLTLPDTTKGELNAEVFRPEKQAVPKTLVIIVPGAGNISRKGEAAGDGIDSYPQPVDVSTIWARALVERGYFVVSYDKRTCTKKVSTLCQNNSQKDIESDGIIALARDLDQVYQYIKSKLSLKNNEVRLMLLTSTQGAQVVSLSESAKEASGIILLSPIIGSLEDMWVDGLTRGFESTTDFNRKNRLGNQKESMKGFFTSLKAGQFPDGAIIRGASVQFWRTWVEASTKTVPQLLNNKRPTLALFSDKDVFATPRMLEDLKKATRTQKNFLVKNLSQFDRNFVSENSVAPSVIEEVVRFVEGVPAKAL